MYEQKISFLKNDLFALIKNLPAESTAGWGKMNAQQMIEHLTDFFNVSTGKIKFDLVTPEEQLPKYKDFILSDKEFRENTKAPASVLGEEPLPVKKENIKEAMDDLQLSVKDFFNYFEINPGKKTMHPVFGSLNFEEWILLHYKHVTHHLRQFGLINKA